MNKHSVFILGLALAIFTSCSSKNSDNSTPVDTSSNGSLPPVETKAANSDYKPAFTEQTRIAGVKTTTPYESAVLTESLQSPWGMTQLPDGRLLITQKDGTLKIVTSAGAVSADITGLPAVNSGGQGGLLDIALDPQFSSNRMIYWTFSEATTGGNLTAVAKGKLSSDEKQVENATVIYRATPAYNSVLHYGGRILFDKTGNIIFSTGERSDLATRPQAQWHNSSLGKTIRITTDGQAASGNPFIGRSDARPELYSYGHRNVQSLALHPETGDLWEGEFGPRGGDEINRIEPGKNYGWPTITYGIEYSGEKVGDGIQQKDGLEQPVYYWDPVVSPSGMDFYSSSAIPEWKNNLFIGSLSATHIVRLVIKNNKITGEERLLSDEGQRFRDVLCTSDGVLYAITDGGRLYKVAKK